MQPGFSRGTSPSAAQSSNIVPGPSSPGPSNSAAESINSGLSPTAGIGSNNSGIIDGTQVEQQRYNHADEEEKSTSRRNSEVLQADEIEEESALRSEEDCSLLYEVDRMDMDSTARDTSTPQQRIPRAPTPPNHSRMSPEDEFLPIPNPSIDTIMEDSLMTAWGTISTHPRLRSPISSNLATPQNEQNSQQATAESTPSSDLSETEQASTSQSTSSSLDLLLDEIMTEVANTPPPPPPAQPPPPPPPPLTIPQLRPPFMFPNLLAIGPGGIMGPGPVIFGGGIGGGHFMATEDYLYDDPTAEYFDEPLLDIESDNPDFARFCERLYYYSHFDSSKFKISPEATEVKSWKRREEITRGDMLQTGCDFQGIPWDKLGMKREEFRQLRNKNYQNYRNIKHVAYSKPEPLPNNRRYFNFLRQDNTQRVRFVHFQLRNLLGVTSKNDIYYSSGDSRIRRTGANMAYGSDIVMDLSTSPSPTASSISPSHLHHNPSPFSSSCTPMKITTMATRHGICIAGGFSGEYAMKILDDTYSPRPTVAGTVTVNDNGITNHVHLHLARDGGGVRAVFSSNDNKLRVIDCGRNAWVAEQAFDFPINCSATSPDGRLRVIVGDQKDVVIVDADHGSTLRTLTGHQDYGFSCAWSDDGHTLATGNQDKTVRIYDARNFQYPIAVIGTEIAGARALRFSEAGSGRRVLVIPEPADYVSVVDAVTWDVCQRFDFFGEVGGAEFDPVGGDLYIANTDGHVGGLMSFARAREEIVSLWDEGIGAGEAEALRKGAGLGMGLDGDEPEEDEVLGVYWEGDREDSAKRRRSSRRATPSRTTTSSSTSSTPYRPGTPTRQSSTNSTISNISTASTSQAQSPISPTISRLRSSAQPTSLTSPPPSQPTTPSITSSSGTTSTVDTAAASAWWTSSSGGTVRGWRSSPASARENLRPRRMGRYGLRAYYHLGGEDDEESEEEEIIDSTGGEAVDVELDGEEDGEVNEEETEDEDDDDNEEAEEEEGVVWENISGIKEDQFDAPAGRSGDGSGDNGEEDELFRRWRAERIKEAVKTMEKEDERWGNRCGRGRTWRGGAGRRMRGGVDVGEIFV